MCRALKKSSQVYSEQKNWVTNTKTKVLKRKISKWLWIGTQSWSSFCGRMLSPHLKLWKDYIGLTTKGWVRRHFQIINGPFWTSDFHNYSFTANHYGLSTLTKKIPLIKHLEHKPVKSFLATGSFLCSCPSRSFETGGFFSFLGDGIWSLAGNISLFIGDLPWDAERHFFTFLGDCFFSSTESKSWNNFFVHWNYFLIKLN